MLNANKTIESQRDGHRHFKGHIPHNAFSIEIECEGDNLALPNVHTPLWDLTNDNSLRGESCEYKLAKPTPITKLNNVLDQWDHIQDRSLINYQSKRTSTHIHVNFNDKTVLQTYTACVTFWFLENLLLKFCNEDRTANLFCLRLEDANDHLTTILEVARNKRAFYQMWHDNERYANLNLMALRKFGTLEVRCMDGNATRDRLELWIKTVYSILNTSIKFDNPSKLLEFYDKLGPEGVLDALLPVDIAKYWLAMPNFADYIDENYSFLLLIASSTNTWEPVDENKDNIFEQDRLYNPINDFLQPPRRRRMEYMEFEGQGDEDGDEERLLQEEDELEMEEEGANQERVRVADDWNEEEEELED